MRSFLSIIAGVVVGIFGVYLVEMINLSIYPIPQDLHLAGDSARISHYTEQISYTILVLLGNVVGCFIAAFITGMVARSMRLKLGILAGTILLLFTVFSGYTSNYPIILILGNIVITALAAYFGAKLGASRIVS